MDDDHVISKTENEGHQSAKSRTRSPAYPAINLEVALERARQIWSCEQRNAAPVEALASHWKLNPKSSTVLLAVSALKKFGLLEELDGKQRRLKLSPLALNILLHEEDAPERAVLLKEAALRPKIHAELWAEYGGVLPSDATLRHKLLIDHEFNADAVSGFISEFRETIAYAKLTSEDSAPASQSISNAPAGEDPGKSAADPKAPQLRQSASTLATQTSSTTVSREFTFPVPSGTVVLRLPFPMSEADYSTLIQTLEIFKPGIVKSDIPTVCTDDVDWQQQAAALAEAGVSFILIGFSYAHHIKFYTELTAKFNLDSRFDPAKCTAQFRPRSASRAGSDRASV